VGDRSNAVEIAGLRTRSLVGGQTINQIYQTIVTETGTQSALAKHYSDTQSLTLEQFTAQQESISGVSLDEEMTDMVKFQQAYNAAARVLTACDEMLSTLLEKTGVVGR
jgi:flagellar hook-associated protein 1 FlgK